MMDSFVYTFKSRRLQVTLALISVLFRDKINLLSADVPKRRKRILRTRADAIKLKKLLRMF
jgi:hypothetical protein